jgi:two-component system LytT family sensor kinase
MTDTRLVIQTLGFAAGAILFGLLIALARRAERLAARKSFGPQSAALGLLWNAGKLVQYVGLLAGMKETSLLLQSANAAAYSALAVLPSLLLLANLIRLERRERFRRALPYVSLALAATLVFGFAASLLASLPFTLSQLMTLTAYNLMLHLAAIAFLFRGAKTATPLFARVELFLLTGLAAMLIVILHLASGETWMTALVIIAQQSSIPIALVSFASLSRFRFADVFIKRSFVILATVIIAMLYSLLMVEPIVSAVRRSSGFPLAASLVATTAMWVVMLLLFPAVRHLVVKATDKLLFRRPDYRLLARDFARESERIEDETQLFAMVERYARSALNAERVRALDNSVLRSRESDSDIRYLETDDPLSNSLGEPRVEMLVPVRVNGKAKYHLALSAGRTGRSLLSDELAFLSAIGESASRALELLEFERERRNRRERESSLKRLLAEAELKALRAQINPHFLFNALNTIADLITSEPEKAEAMTERLAEVFRCVLARTDREMIRVSEEIDFLRTYLSIEQTRFGDRLRVSIEIDPEIANALIPSFILQPIVENAIKHGLSPRLEGGELRILALKDADELRLVVEDDGAGWQGSRTMNEEKARSQGVGLRNVNERLRAIYGERASLKIVGSTGKGVAVTIAIPKDETQNFNERRRSVGPVSIA